MTLDTRVLILKPHAVAEVREWINTELLGAPEARPVDPTYWRQAYPDRITSGNAGGQGLPAWLLIWHHADGPIAAERCAYDDDTDEETCTVIGEGSMLLSFDTAYGYRDELGRGCMDLHRRYIARLTERFGPVLYQDEYSGEWFRCDEPDQPVRIP